MNAKTRMIDLSDIVGGNCYVIKSLFTSEYCDNLVDHSIAGGFVCANDKYPESYRNNDRYWEDNTRLTDDIFQILNNFTQRNEVPHKLTKDLVGLNTRLRFCKYTSGQTFNIHRDGIYHKNNTESSKMTFLLYLNDDDEYTGGETKFFKEHNSNTLKHSYRGQKGDLIIFDHDLWHEGSEVLSGRKLILRSDLVYKNTDLAVPCIKHDAYIWKVIKNDNGFITGSRDKSIKFWDQNFQYCNQITLHTASVLDLHVKKNNLYSISRDGFIAKSGLSSDRYTLNKKTNSHHGCALNINGFDQNSLYTTGSDGYLRVWNEDLKLIKKIRIHEGWAWSCLPVNTSTMASIGSDGILNLWHKSNLKCLGSLDLNQGSLRSIEVKNNLAYIGSENGSIIKVDLESMQMLKIKPIHRGIVRDIKSSNNTIYSCGEDGYLINTSEDLNISKRLHRHKDFATSVVIDKKGQVFSCGYDGFIKKA